MKKSWITGFLLFAVTALSIPINGYVLKVLWGWFLNPRFTAFTPSFTLCMGLTCILILFKGTTVKYKQYSIREDLAKARARKEPVSTFNPMSYTDIYRLPVSEDIKRRLLMHVHVTDKTWTVSYLNSIMAILAAPMTALVAGWILKHYA